MVIDVDADGLEVKDADGQVRRIPAATKIWAAGVQASPLGRMLGEQSGAEVDRAVRVAVLPDLTLPGHPEVHVVGDMTSLDKLPGVAQVAIQGAVLRRGHQAEGRGQVAAGPFRYFDKGSMATISRFSAVADLGRFKFEGFIAWVIWLVIHLFYIVGFKSRITAVLHWPVSFLGRGRSQRVATQQQVFGRSRWSTPGRSSPRSKTGGVKDTIVAGETTGNAGPPEPSPASGRITTSDEVSPRVSPQVDTAAHAHHADRSGSTSATGALLLSGCTGTEDKPTPSAQVATDCPEEGESFEGRHPALHRVQRDRRGHRGPRLVRLRRAPRGLRVVTGRRTGPPGRPRRTAGRSGHQRLLLRVAGAPARRVLAIEDLQADFPEGEYTVSGTDFEGTPRLGTAQFTHGIPLGPVVTEPRLEDEEKRGAVRRDAVRASPLGPAQDDERPAGHRHRLRGDRQPGEWDDPDSLSRPEYDVHVPPDRTTLPVADGFLLPGTVYELEVIVLEESGNQTITVGFFTTSE